MQIQLWIDLKTGLMGVVKPDVTNRNVHTFEMAPIFHKSFLAAALAADEKITSNDVICIKIAIPQF